MQAVLHAPGRALVIEIEAIATPGMADEIMDRTKAIERTTKLTVEQRMKPVPSGGGRGDLECPNGAYRKDELFVAFIGVGATGERHSDRPVAGVSGKDGEQVIRLQLKLPVRLNHPGIAMSAPGP